MRLTDLAIQKLPAPVTGQKTYFDDALGGFGVRVSQGGTKSFIIMYGKQRRLRTIGRYPSKTLKEARTEAKTFLATLSPETSQITVSDALSAFLSYCETKNKPRTVKDYRYLLTRHLPQGKLTHINRRQLLSYFHSLQHTPGEQSHAVTATNIFLNWCVVNGYIDYNPIAGVRGLGHTKQRDRFLTEDELRELFVCAQNYSFPYGAIISLMILTGQRRGEVAYLMWDYVCEDTITLPVELTKNRREHVFPIGNLTRYFIAEIPRTFDSEYLFPGQGDKPWNGWSKAKKRFDQKHNVTDYTLHDLRRTYASVHAQLGTPIHVIEKLLNHVSGSFSGVAGIYNRYSYLEEMKSACDQYENYISSLAS